MRKETILPGGVANVYVISPANQNGHDLYGFQPATLNLQLSTPLLSSLLYISSASMLRPINIAHPSHLDSLELDILNKREVFHLPPQHICDGLVDIFFNWIAPVLPVVDRHDFMRKYYDRENSPSILLLHAIFMTASRFYRPQGYSAAMTPRAFYKKAKALYDAGYELNGISVLQAVVLMGLYWDGPNGKCPSLSRFGSY